jgi:roadblock/LC7 domain-containing protein
MRYAIHVNATGSAAFITDEQGSTFHVLVQTATGATTTLASTGGTIQGAWSADGAHLVYWSGLGTETIRMIDSTGANDTAITTTGAHGFTPMFSPDGKLLAYASGASAMTVRNLAASTSAVLALPGTQILDEPNRFSPDGAMLAVYTFDSQIAIAATDHTGTFTDVATYGGQSLPVYPCEWSQAHDFISVLIKQRQLWISPTAHAVGVPVDQPGFYEPVATAPSLLLFTSTNASQSGIYGSVAMFPAAGTGTGTLVPGAVLPAFTQSQLYHSPQPAWQGADSGSGQIAEPFTWGWLGSEIVYESDRDGVHPYFDVIAATDTVGTVGVLAPGANVWAVRAKGIPTRMFYSRASTGGTWFSALPQTPGR